MSVAERNGVKIYYEVHGRGPAVLLSHGFTASSRRWTAQVAAFRDRYTVIIWDMRGHGRTDSPPASGEYSVALTTEDMAAVLDACGVERAVIGGLSLGGYMSLAFNLRYPERVRALMLFDTGPGYKNEEARRAWNDRALLWADELEARGLAAVPVRPELTEPEHRSADGLARAARGMLVQRDAEVMLSLDHIAVPTLVLVGADDLPFRQPAEYMARKIPDADLVVIPAAGHVANLDQPAAFNQAVDAFLARLPDSPDPAAPATSRGGDATTSHGPAR